MIEKKPNTISAESSAGVTKVGYTLLCRYFTSFLSFEGDFTRESNIA